MGKQIHLSPGAKVIPGYKSAGGRCCQTCQNSFREFDYLKCSLHVFSVIGAKYGIVNPYGLCPKWKRNG